MLNWLSKEIKQILIAELCQKYDEINAKLNRDFVKMHYEEEEIEYMQEELRKIEQAIKDLND